MNASLVIDVLGLAGLQGLLVALPRGRALNSLRRVRSRCWAAAPLAAIIVGTFAPLTIPGAATALVILAVLSTPPLLVIAIVLVVRGPRLPVAGAAIAFTAMSLTSAGTASRICATGLTALACLTLGVAIAQVTPRRWLLAGVLAMCVADVVLLCSGVGVIASAAMNAATHHFNGPALDRGQFGPLTIDYPDLVLAAIAGGFLAEEPSRQRRIAALLTGATAAYEMLLPVARILPETVPIALMFALAKRESSSCARAA